MKDLPSGFVLDDAPPAGFVVDQPPTKTARVVSGANRGLAGMLGFPVDAMTALMSPVARVERPFLGGQQIGDWFRSAGIDIDQPRDFWGMLGEYALPSVVSGPLNVARGAAGGPIVRKATELLGAKAGPVVGHAAREGVAATAAVGGGLLGQQIAEKTGTSPLAWEMAGAMTPGAMASLAAAAPRYALRKPGGSAFAADPAMQARIAELEAQGIPTTVGLATDSPAAKSREAKLAASPGGYEVLRATGREADAAFDATQQRIVGGSRDSAGAAGAVMRDGGGATGGGIFGRGGWLDRSKAQNDANYAALDAKIPPRTPVTSVNTDGYFQAYTTVDPASPALSAGGKDPRIMEWAKAYRSDTQASLGQLPYERLKDLRSQVGAALEVTDPSVVNSKARADMKALYGALSRDMEDIARVSGASREFTLANRFNAQRATRIDTWLENLGKKVKPEDFWRAAGGDSPQSATQLQAYKRMLKPDEWDYMVETLSNRWMKSAPGQETIAHQASLNKWHTNWNKTPLEVRDVLFGKQGTPKRDAADLMARNLDKYREQAQVLYNSSGSGATGLAASAQYGAIGGVGTAVLGFLTGHVASPAEAVQAAVVGTAGGVAMATAGSAGLARITTNPNFAKWLAQGMEMPRARLPGHLMRLASISRNDEELREPAREIIQALDPALASRLYK